MESKMEINAIVWSMDIEAAKKHAATFTQGNQNEQGFFTSSNADYNLNTFVRCPDHPITATPSSITDIVMVVVEDESEAEMAQKYLDSRRGIPFKICLTTKIGEFSELESKQVNPGEIANERANILKEALAFEKTLVNVFKKFDVNGNGLISTDELLQISKELGHELSLDDAKMITDTLDKDKKGNIDFNGFKKWWVTGKSDFSNFRRIVKAEMSVNNLVKMTSTKFNNYLSNLNEESHNVAQNEVQQSFALNLHSENQFENGVGIFIDISSGDDAKEIIDSKPENIRNSPAFISISMEMDNNEIAAQTAEMLNEMIVPMLDSIPELQAPRQMGVKFAVRANQNKLVADVTFENMIAEIIASQTAQFNVKDLKASGNGTLHVFTAMDVKDVYTKDLNAFELIEKALNFKLNLQSKSYNLRGAVDSICGMLENQMQSGGELSSKFKVGILAARAAGVLRDFSLDFKFSPSDILDLIILKLDKSKVSEEMFHKNNFEEYKKKIANPDNEGKMASKLADLRNTIDNAFEEQGPMMREMVPPEFVEIIKSINMEKIEAQCGTNLESMRSSYKITANLPGMNSIKDKLLN